MRLRRKRGKQGSRYIVGRQRQKQCEDVEKCLYQQLVGEGG